MPQPEGPSAVEELRGPRRRARSRPARARVVPRPPLLGDGAHLDVGGGRGPHPIPGRWAAARAAPRATESWRGLVARAGRGRAELIDGTLRPPMPPRWRSILAGDRSVRRAAAARRARGGAGRQPGAAAVRQRESGRARPRSRSRRIRREAAAHPSLPRRRRARRSREAVAETLGLCPTQLVFGKRRRRDHHAARPRAASSPGDEVVVRALVRAVRRPRPGYPEPRSVPSPLRDYRIDLDDVLRAHRVTHLSLVCLTSPAQSDRHGARPGPAWERFCARCPQRRHGAPRRGLHRFHRGAGRAPRTSVSAGSRPEQPGAPPDVLEDHGARRAPRRLRDRRPRGDRALRARAENPSTSGAPAQAGAAAGARDTAHRDKTAAGVVWARGVNALAAAFAARGLDASADRIELLPGPPGTTDAAGVGGAPGTRRAGARQGRGRLSRAPPHQRRHCGSRTRVCSTRSTAPSPAEGTGSTGSSCSSDSAWPRAWPSGGPARARPPSPSSSTPRLLRLLGLRHRGLRRPPPSPG